MILVMCLSKKSHFPLLHFYAILYRVMQWRWQFQECSYILLLNMPAKPERLLNPTSKTVLKQLEQNESLRIELFRLKTELREQHHRILNSTVNQQMFVEKIVTQLSLAYRRCKDMKKYTEEQDIIVNAVKYCIGDLQALTQGMQKSKIEWGKCEKDDGTAYYEQLLKDCSTRFDQAEGVIEKLSKDRDSLANENMLKATQIEFLQCQLGKLHSKLQESLKENGSLKEQISKNARILSQSKAKEGETDSQITKLKVTNEELTVQLRQSREVANRHAEYVHTKCNNIEKENQRLVQLQRQSCLKEQQLTRNLQENFQEVERLYQENYRLAQEVQALKLKFKEIIQKQEKIKELESQKTKRQSRAPLSEIPTQNSLESTESKPLKRQAGKMTKRFNLQSFQQKLSNSSSSASFFPH